jgi:membrane-associated phospholipid phosphatase
MLKKLNNYNMKYIKDNYLPILKTLDKYDKSISKYVHHMELENVKEFIVYIFARMYNPDLIFIYFVSILLLTRDFILIIKLLIHTSLSLIFTIVVKKLTTRPRPNKADKTRLFDLRQHEVNFSMPSGDSLQAANFAILLYGYFGTTIGFFIIPLVMFSRIFYFCHYILDTVVGSLCGISISYITYNILN